MSHDYVHVPQESDGPGLSVEGQTSRHTWYTGIVDRRGARVHRRGATADRREGVPDWRRSSTDLQLQEQLHLWQESERKRIAAELHDSIGASLSATKIGLEHVVKRLRAEAPHFAVKSLGRVMSALQGTMEEVHRIAMNLRPSILDDLGIVATIGWYSREFESDHRGVRVVTQISVHEQDLPDSLKTTIYRMLQEAMNNAITHGNADLIRITLSHEEHEIRLAIEDNGKGFDISEPQAKDGSKCHFGIASMRHRAECSGGSLVIQSARGAGTRVSATWPDTISAGARSVACARQFVTPA